MHLKVKLSPYLVVLRAATGAARLSQVPLKRVHPGIRLATAAVERTSIVQKKGMPGAQAGRRWVGRGDATADVSGQFCVLVCLHMAQKIPLALCRLREPADRTFEHALSVSARSSACGGREDRMRRRSYLAVDAFGS